MQSNFSACLAFTLKFEGGKVNDPRDPGGRTNQGVTQRTYDGYRKGAGLAPRTVYDMADAERDAIYAAGFWAKVGGALRPAGVDLAAFDFGVNSGPARANRIAVDGLPPVEAVKKICAARSSFLHGLRTWATFGKGWAARVAACEALGVKMALGAAGHAPAAVTVSLDQHAAAAGKKATARRNAAKAGAVSAAATSASTPAATHLPIGLIVALGASAALVALGAAYLAWRAMHESARAEAYSDLAKAA